MEAASEGDRVMSSFNKITIVGYLGRDPEIRYTPTGTAVCDFSVATTERRKGKDGEPQDSTTWFKVIFFGRQAEVASQFLTKGKQVYIEGRLSEREWTDRDGNARKSLEVTGTELQFLSAKGSDDERPQAKAATAAADEDDVGF
jgi:single-strand DNA-binding protein